MSALLAAAAPALKVRNLEVGTPQVSRSRELAIANLDAQPGGFFAWMVRLFGGGTTTSVSLTSQRVMRRVRKKNAEAATTIPLANLASLHYEYAKTPAKMIVGILFAMLGLVGLVAKPFIGIFFLLLAGGFITWHILSGPKLSLLFSSQNGISIFIKVDAGQQTNQLVQFAEAAHEQVRLATQPVAAAPVASPPPPPGVFSTPRA